MRLARKSVLSTAVDYIARLGVGILGVRARRPGRGRFFLLSDDYIGRTILAEGAFEKGYLASLEGLIRLARAGDLMQAERSVALDIGANIGTHTVFLARHFDKVHSFEPNPMLHHVLCANIGLNGLGGVTPHQVALSDRAETLSYVQTEAGNLGCGRFERATVDQDATRSFPLVRGDDVLLPLLQPGERVVLAKIDVEGLEDKVVAGLEALLQRDQPLLVCEVTGREGGERLCEVLDRAGYPYCYEIHNPARFNSLGLAAGVARALARGIEYQLKPLADLEDRLYPMVVAAPVDLLACNPSQAIAA